MSEVFGWDNSMFNIATMIDNKFNIAVNTPETRFKVTVRHKRRFVGTQYFAGVSVFNVYGLDLCPGSPPAAPTSVNAELMFGDRVRLTCDPVPAAVAYLWSLVGHPSWSATSTTVSCVANIGAIGAHAFTVRAVRDREGWYGTVESAESRRTAPMVEVDAVIEELVACVVGAPTSELDSDHTAAKMLTGAGVWKTKLLAGKQEASAVFEVPDGCRITRIEAASLEGSDGQQMSIHAIDAMGTTLSEICGWAKCGTWDIDTPGHYTPRTITMDSPGTRLKVTIRHNKNVMGAHWLQFIHSNLASAGVAVFKVFGLAAVPP